MKNDGSNVEKYSALSVIKNEEGGSLLLWNDALYKQDNILYRVVLALW